MREQLDRIRRDVECGGTVGLASTRRLLDLLSEIIQEVEKLQRRRGTA